MSDERAADPPDDESVAGDEATAVEESTDEATTESVEPDDTEAEDTGPPDDEPTAAEDADGGLADGDFVRLEYTIRTVEDGTLVDTTREATAEEEGVDMENRDFEPRTVVIGAGHVFGSVEDDLIGKEVGDTDTVTIAAEDAFGEYDASQVRTVSADKIPENQRHPGGHVDIDGQHGHVETIIGGRARVDFNHPLAGEDIEYEYEIVDVVDDRVEQARGLLDLYVDAGGIDLSIEVDEEEQPVEQDVTDEDDEDAETEAEAEADDPETELVELETLYIESAPQLAMNQQWLFSKGQIAADIIERIGVDRVIVREILDGGGMAGMGGMLGGMGGGGDLDAELEEALEDVDVDAEEIVEGLESEELSDEAAAPSDAGDE